jgi:hypothetical protein
MDEPTLLSQLAMGGSPDVAGVMMPPMRSDVCLYRRNPTTALWRMLHARNSISTSTWVCTESTMQREGEYEVLRTEQRASCLWKLCTQAESHLGPLCLIEHVPVCGQHDGFACALIKYHENQGGQAPWLPNPIRAARGINVNRSFFFPRRPD